MSTMSSDKDMQLTPASQTKTNTTPRFEHTAEFQFDDPDQYEFAEASFLLAFWSILVITEAVVRFVQQGRPAVPGLLSASEPTRFWGMLMGALFELIFGVFGLLVGLAGGILDYYSHTLTCVLFLVQVLFGAYVFIAYVIVIPAYRIASETPQLSLSVDMSKTLGALGICTSAAFCLALQGGQFVFITRLIAYSGPDDFLEHRGTKACKRRAILWNCIYAGAGLCTLVSGAILIAFEGSGLTDKPFFAPPNVGRSPVFLLITGIIMVVWPTIGIFITAMDLLDVVRDYVCASFVVFLFIHISYTIGQLGLISGNLSPPGDAAAAAALHSHLTFMLCFLPPYFMFKHLRARNLEIYP